MDSLKATYRDEDDEDSSNNNTTSTTSNGLTEPIRPSTTMTTVTPTTITTPDTEPEPLNGIKEEPIGYPSSEEIYEDNPQTQEPQEGSENLKDSPKFTKVSETEDEEEDEDEDPPPKKQKQLSSLTSPVTPKPERQESQETAAVPIPTTQPTTAMPKPSVASSKKSKKKGNNVWTKSTSRKGKKKIKCNNHNNQTEDTVLITPIPRFPDKNDDSPDMEICLSKVYKAEKVELSEDRLSAGSTKGYRMVRATRGVMEGTWYFEIKVVQLGETGHTRLGWSTEKGDLQAPVGYDGNSFGYRDIDGTKIHKALREKYGEEGYKEGDVIGFYINLPEGNSYAPKPPHLVWYKGQRYVCAPDSKEDPPKVVPGE
ncbi:unnamed protein product [Ilex paraguariensis]|uniref:B30.2/SPRY domain-containing protein n=1 Tax=Ilex paraguariensis TaxID=185542 RepID=A0ABC8UQX2_9AQUA